jgi:hypothetical protein
LGGLTFFRAPGTEARRYTVSKVLVVAAVEVEEDTAAAVQEALGTAGGSNAIFSPVVVRHGERAIRIIPQVEADLARDRERAEAIQPGDWILWWDDSRITGEYRKQRVVEVGRDKGDAPQYRTTDEDRWISGYEVDWDTLNEPLWNLDVGDELEWWCQPLEERLEQSGVAHGKREQARALRAAHVGGHDPDPEPPCPGGTWHRGKITKVEYHGRRSPFFDVEGCFWSLRQDAGLGIRIRVPA